MPRIDDKLLVQQTLSGDKSAFGRLVDRYKGAVFGLAFNRVKDFEQAKDISQEAFIEAYLKLETLREHSKFSSWLCTITANLCKMWLRRKGRRTLSLDDLDWIDEIPGQRKILPPPLSQRQPKTPEEEYQDKSLRESILAAIDALPPKSRETVVLYYMDGLSYKDIADFLALPVSTVRGRLENGRKKLKQGMITMVEETLKREAPKEEFARKVLENIADLDWGKSGECTFGGSVVACMQFLGEDATYDFVMGVSGGAFKLLWSRVWCPSNNSMGILGPEPVRRTFRALGYEHELVSKTDSPKGEQQFRRKIVRSIQNGHPIISMGIVGPPDEGIVAGYERSGEVLLGRSYFYDGSKGYYQKADWYKDCWGLILVGEKKKAPAKLQILRDALQWAVQLSRTPESAQLPGAKAGRASGIAAYDVWAEALKRDEDFPLDDLKALAFRCQVNKSVTLSGLCDARRAAVAFLKDMAAVENSPKSALREATAAYEQELRILDQGMKLVPYCHDSEEKLPEMAEPARRRQLAELLSAAKKKEQQAVECLERALREMEAN